MFPLYRERNRLRALANVHTPLFRPLAADAAALDSLLAEVAGACSQLHVFGLPVHEEALTALIRTAAAQNRLPICEPAHVSPIVDTNGDLERYLNQQRSKLRETSRRRRKMQREHGAVFHSIERPRDLRTEIESGLRLEGSGWKGKEGSAILSAPQTARFYRSIADAFHARDELRLSTLELDGRLAGFDFALVAGGRYWLLKTAYDESLARLGPGMAMRLAVVERCFESGMDAHEFLGDDMEYKRRFSTSDRAHVEFRAYSRSPVPAGSYVYRRYARPAVRRGYRELGGGRSRPRKPA